MFRGGENGTTHGPVLRELTHLARPMTIGGRSLDDREHRVHYDIERRS